MARKPLSSQQRQKLEMSIQAGFDAAGRALKMLLSGDVRIGIVPQVEVRDGVEIRLGLIGALAGGVRITLPEIMALEIVKNLTAAEPVSLFDEQARSVLMEFGNILASAFVAHFDQHQGLRTLPTPPELTLVRTISPVYDSQFCGELHWSSCLERGRVLIGLDGSALDILLGV